jgi:hypothetical protein
MQLINGISSLFFLWSAYVSRDSKNMIWKYSIFTQAFSSFMYNTHKFDVYNIYPDRIIYIDELSEEHDYYLLFDYLNIFMIAYAVIPNQTLKNILVSGLLIEYLQYNTVNISKMITFSLGCALTIGKCFLIDKERALNMIFFLLNGLYVINIRYEYYTRETQLENVICTYIWHYCIVQVLCMIAPIVDRL